MYVWYVRIYMAFWMFECACVWGCKLCLREWVCARALSTVSGCFAWIYWLCCCHLARKDGFTPATRQRTKRWRIASGSRGNLGILKLLWGSTSFTSTFALSFSRSRFPPPRGISSGCLVCIEVAKSLVFLPFFHDPKLPNTLQYYPNNSISSHVLYFIF